MSYHRIRLTCVTLWVIVSMIASPLAAFATPIQTETRSFNPPAKAIVAAPIEPVMAPSSGPVMSPSQSSQYAGVPPLAAPTIYPPMRVRWDGGSFNAAAVDGCWPVYTALTVRVQRVPGITEDFYTVADWNGMCYYYLGMFSAPITDTAQVSVMGGGLTQVVEVEPMINARLNPYAETLSGRLADVPNTPLQIAIGGLLRQVTSNASGNFSLNLSGEYDVAVGDTAVLYYANADGNLVYYRPRATGLRMRWDTWNYDENDIDGWFSQPFTILTVTRQAPFAVSSPTDFNEDNYFSDVDFVGTITDPNTISVTNGAITLAVSSAALTAVGNAFDDTVYGYTTLPVGTHLVAEYAGYRQETNVGTGGQFTFSFADVVDLTEWYAGWIRHTASSGHEVYYDYYVGDGRSEVFLHGHYNGAALDFAGWFPRPNTEVVVTHLQSGEMATVTSNLYGSLPDIDFPGVWVETGDTIRMSDGQLTRNIVAPAAFNGVGEANSDSVTGRGPADIANTNDAVYPNFLVNIDGQNQYVTTDGSGNFTADFSDLTELQRSDDGYIRYADAAGPIFYRNIRVPGLETSFNATGARGYFPESGLIVDGILRDPLGTTKGTFTATVSAENWFDQNFNAGQVGSGDSIEVGNGQISLTLTVPGLQGPGGAPRPLSNPALDMISGRLVTPAGGVPVANTDDGMYPLLYVYTQLQGGASSDAGYVTADASGNFSFAPEGDIWGGDYGRVEYTDAEGDFVGYWDGFRASGIRVEYGSTHISGEGFVAGVVVTATHSQEPGNPQTATTDNLGYFDQWFGFADVFDVGDIITVTDGVNSYSVAVPDLKVRAYAAADAIYGSGLNSTLEVGLSSNGTYYAATPRGGGEWEVDLHGVYDFDLEEYLYYRYTENDGDQVYLSNPNTLYQVGNTTDASQVRWDTFGWDQDGIRGFFSGYADTAPAMITVTLYAPDGTLLAQDTDAFVEVGGLYEVDMTIPGDDAIHDGEVVLASDGVQTITINVPTYTVSAIDYAADRIAGTIAYTDGANPVEATGTLTDVFRAINESYSGNWAYSAGFNSNASGAYALDMSSTPRGIHPGDWLRYQYVDEAGQEVYFANWMLTSVDADLASGEIRWDGNNLDWDHIRGYWTQANINLDIVLYDASTGNSYNNVVWADANRWFAHDYFGPPTPVFQGGDVITLTDVAYGGTNTLVIPILDAQVNVNVDTDRVSLSGLPASTDVQVELYSSRLGGWVALNGRTNAAGAATLNFSGLADIVAGDYGHVMYERSDFAIYTRFDVPYLQVYARQNQVYLNVGNPGGDDWLGVNYTLRLLDSSGVEKDSRSGSTGDGVWENFDDLILPGDQIALTVDYPAGSQAANLVIPAELSVSSVDWQNDVVVVTAPAGITDTGGAELPYLQLNIGSGQWLSSTTSTYEARDFGDIGRNASGQLLYRTSQAYDIYLNFNDPVYRVYENAGGDDVAGYTLLPGATVVATLKDAGGTPRATWRDISGGGCYFGFDLYDQYGYDVKVRPGDIIELDVEGEGLTTIVAPAITSQADFNTDEVVGAITGSGVSLPITGTNNDQIPSLYVYSGGTGQTQYVSTDGGGAFVADAIGDFAAGSSGEVRYVRDDGNEVYAYWRAPWMQVRWDGSAYAPSEVRVSDPTNGNGVTVTLQLMNCASGYVKDVEIFWLNGTANRQFVDTYNNAVRIENGDCVIMTAAGRSYTVHVPATFDVSADYTANTISGQIAEAGVVANPLDSMATVTNSLYVDGFNGPNVYISTDANGAFSVELNDFDANTNGGYVRFRDAAGNEVYQRALAPWAMIELEGSRVDGTVAGANVPINVSLKRGSEVVDTEQAQSDVAGRFAVVFLDMLGNEVMIEGGDQVVIEASPPIVIDVPLMTVDASATSDIVSGTLSLGVTTSGPDILPNLRLKLDVGTGLYVWITTSSSPYRFSHDFSGVYDLQANDTGEVRYTDNNGNQIYLNFSVPPLSAAAYPPELTLRDGGASHVAGRVAYGDQDVSLMLYHGSLLKGTLETTADNNGYFGGFPGLNFVDAAGNSVEIADGDRVVMTSEATYVNYTVPALTGLEINPEADAITGTLRGTGVNNPITLTFGISDNLYVEVIGSEYVSTTVTGRFSTLNTSSAGDVEWMGFSYGDSGRVRYEDQIASGGALAELHRVFYDFVVEDAPVQPDDQLDVHVRYMSGYQPNPARIEGDVAWPNEPVTLTLKSSTGVLKSQVRTVSDAGTRFDITFADAAGNDEPILDGDIVEIVSRNSSGVVFTRTIRVATVSNLQFDHVHDRITGTLTGSMVNNPISYTVWVTRDAWYGSIEWVGPGDVPTQTNAAGQFTFDNLGDFGAGANGRFVFRNVMPNGANDDWVEQHDVYYAFTTPYDDFTFEALRAQVYDDSVYAQANYNDQPVTFRLYEGSRLLDTAHGFSNNQANFPEAITRPGQRVEVSYDANPGVTRAFTLPAMNVTDVDTDNELVEGAAGFSDDLEVNWNGWFSWSGGVLVGGTTRLVTPISNTWSADFAGFMDLQPGATGGLLLYTDAANNQALQYYAAQRFTVYKDQNVVEGAVYNGGVTVTLTLLDNAGLVKDSEELLANNSGGFTAYFEDLYDNAVWIRGGDQVVIQASNVVTIEVPELSAWGDWYADMVVGVSSLFSQTINVSLGGGSCDMSVNTDAGGDYHADFAGLCDLTSGNTGHVYYQDAGGNRLALRFHTPAVYIRNDYDTNRLSGYTAAGTEVTVTVELASAGGDVKSAMATTWGTGSHGWYDFDLVDQYDNPTRIETGDILTITETSGMGVRQQTFSVPAMTAHSNVQTDIVSGQVTSGPGAQVEVDVQGWQQTVTSTVGGAYEANFATINPTAYDILPGDRVHLNYADTANGRWFYFENRAPVVAVRAYWGYDSILGWSWLYGEGVISGYTDSYATVVLTLWRDGNLVGSRFGSADGYGYYQLAPQDAYFNTVTIEDGDVVMVQSDGQAWTVNVTPVTFNPDVAAQTVAGQGTGFTGSTTFEVYFDAVARTALVDNTGAYVATFPLNTFVYGQYGYADHLDAHFNLVYYRFYVPARETFVRVLQGDATDDSGYNWNVGGRLPSRDTALEITLSAGTTVKSIAYATTDNNGNFGAMLPDSYGAPIAIAAGDTVRVEAQGISALQVTVPPMTIAGDSTTGLVNGSVDSLNINQTALITNSILVNRLGALYMDSGRSGWTVPSDTLAVTATAGLFSATFDPLYTGDRLNVLYTDNDGNEFYIITTTLEAEPEAQPAVVRAWVNNNWVGGLAYFADETITVTLQSGLGGVKSTFTGNAGGGRGFGAWALLDAAGDPARIEPGDTLQVEFGQAGVTLNLPVADPFTLEADADTDIVSGTLGNLNIAANPFITGSLIVNVGGYDVAWWAAEASNPLSGGTNRTVTVTSGVYSTTWDSAIASQEVWALYTNDEGHQFLQNINDGLTPDIGKATVSVYANENYVGVVHPQSGMPVTVTLWQNSYQIAEGTYTGGGTVYLRDVYDSDHVFVRAGDVVQVDFETTEGVKTYQVTVPALSALANPLDDTVSGSGPAGQPIEVNLNGVDRTVVPDPNFSVNYTGLFDIQPGSGGLLWSIITDTDEALLQVYMDFRAPQVTAYKGYNQFSGFTAFNDGSGTPVAATLYRGGQVVGRSWFMSYGYYNNVTLCDVYDNCNVDQGNAAALRPGDELVVAARGEPEIHVTIPELTAWADVNEDVVRGDTNLPDVDIELEMNGVQQTVRTDASGAYLAAYNTPPFVTDIQRGDSGYARYQTPAGQRVELALRAPFVRAYLGQNQAYIYVASAFNVTGTLTLRSSSGAVKAVRTFNTSAGATLYFYDAFQGPVFIAAGDSLTLEVPDDDAVVLNVPALSASPDPATDRVTVVGPAGIQSTARPSQTLFLDFQGKLSALTSANSTYIAAYPEDLLNPVVPGQAGTVIYTNENGDEVYAGFVTPIVRVHASSPDVDGYAVNGYAQPNRVIGLALRRGGVALWSGATTSNGNGEFGFSLPITIQVGDGVEVSGGGLNATVDVVALDASVDYENEKVIGTGPANIGHTGGPLNTLWVNSDDDADINFDNSTDRYAGGATQVVTTTSTGAFSADFSDQSGDADSGGDRAEVRYISPDGHQVYAQFDARASDLEPQINIWQGYRNGIVIWGIAGERDAVVWVTVYQSDGVTERATWRGTSDSAGNFWVDASALRNRYNESVRIEAGDRVEVKTLEWSSGSIHVVALSAIADIENDLVDGRGPANIVNLGGEKQTLVVSLGAASAAVTTTASGDFSLDLDALGVDIARGDTGELRYTHSSGHVIYRTFRAPGATVWKDTDFVSGVVSTPRMTTTVSLWRGGAMIGEWWSDLAYSDGEFNAYLKDASGAPAIIRQGDEVRVSTDSGESFTVVVPTLSVTADPATEIVSGNGPANGERVIVSVYSGGGWTERDASVFGGAYSYDFSGLKDIKALDVAQVEYRTADGDWILATSGLPGIDVQLYDPNANGKVAQTMATVSFTLQAANGFARASAVDISDYYGWSLGALTDIYGNPVEVMPGDQLVVQSLSSTSYVIPGLTALANVEEDTVSGSGPASSQLEVCVGYCQTVWSDVTGAYTANFKGRTDIEGGNTGWLRYVDGAGNTYRLNFSAPRLHVEYQGDPQNGSQVYGNTNHPYVTYTLELERAGVVIGRLAGQSGSDGWYSLYLIDLYGNPLLTQDTDVVIIKEEGVETNRVTVRALEATVDILADVVKGVGPAGAALHVTAGGDRSKTVIADGSGAFTAANPFYYNDFEGAVDFMAGSGGQVIYRATDGDQIFYNYTAPYLEVWAAFEPGIGSSNSYYAGYVNGQGWPYNRPVMFTLYNSAGAIKDTEARLGQGYNWLGYIYFYDEYNNPVEILPGDRVAAQVSGLPTMEVRVPSVSNLVVDTLADSVAGVLAGTVAALPVNPEGSLTHTLRVYINNGSAERYVDTTASGNFEYVYGEEPLDIYSGSMGGLRYVDLNGNLAHLPFEAGQPQWYHPFVEVWEYGTRARGNVLLAGVPVTITLERGGNALAVESRLSDGNAAFDINFVDEVYDNRVLILPNDVVRVEVAGQSDITVDVVPLSVVPDPFNDRLTGTAPNTGELNVSVGWNSLDVMVSGGAWTADFGANDWDFNAQDNGSVTYTNPDEHLVHLNFRVPMVRAYLHDNLVEGYGVYPNMLVTATLTNGAGNIKAQATVARDEANSDNWFSLRFKDAYDQPVEILAGDTVRVYPYATAPRVLAILTLDARANPETDRVEGAAPANRLVEVAMGPELSVVAGSGGAFAADFTGLINIVAGNAGHLRYLLSEHGDEEWLNFAAPVVWVREGQGNRQGLVHGYADRGGRDVSVEVVRGGNVIASAMGSAAPSYSLYVKDLYGNISPVEAGDIVNVRFDGGTPVPVSLPTTALGAALDVAADTVAVSGPVGARVEVDLGVDFPSASGNQRSAVLTGGQASLDYRGSHDITGGERGYVHWRDANGNSVYTEFSAPAITVYEYDTYITGYVAATSGLARVRLLRGGNEVASGSHGIAPNGGLDNIYLYDKFNQQTLILPGDTVEVTAGGKTYSIPVAELWAWVDEPNNAVSVRGPAGQPIEIDFESGFSGLSSHGVYDYQTITANGSTQVVSFADPVDPTYDTVRPGAYGWLRYQNDGGHWVQRYFRAREVRVYQGRNYVTGYAGYRGAEALVELVRGGNVLASVRTEADRSSGYYEVYFEQEDRPVIIARNDVVRVTVDGAPVNVPAALSASVDVENDRISGAAPGLVEVMVDGYAQTAWPTGGAYTANFAGLTDISGGSQGSLTYLNADGNTVYLDFAAPSIRVEEGSNYVSGYVNNLGTEVEVDVELARGGQRIAAEAVIAGSYNGYFETHLVHADGTRPYIRPGDIVTVSAGGQVLGSVNVQALTADLDEVANTVAGRAPNGELLINVDGNVQTLIASGNAYTATFGDHNMDWASNGYVEYVEADGDRVYREFHAPYFQVEVGNNVVEGYLAYKYVTVTVQVERSSAVIAEQEIFVTGFWSSSCGYQFCLEMLDDSGVALVLQSGDVVRVTAGDAVVSGDATFSSGTLTVPGLSAAVNATTDSVSGAAPDGLLRVTVAGVSRDVTAASGAFSADFSGLVDIQPGTAARVGLYDAEHDLAYFDTAAPQVIVWQGDNRVQGYVAYLPPSTLSAQGGGSSGNNANWLVEIRVMRGGTMVGGNLAWTDSSGWFDAYVRNISDPREPLFIRAGDVVEVQVGGWTANITVVALSASVDTANDTIAVTGPANASVKAYVQRYLEETSSGDPILSEYHKMVSLGSSGSATLGNPLFSDNRWIYELDLVAGDFGYIRYINSDGHEVRRTYAAPMLNAQLSDNRVWGFVNGGRQLVTLILANSQGEKARTYDWTDTTDTYSVSCCNCNGGCKRTDDSGWEEPYPTYGFFDIYFVDSTGHDVIILPGDTVTVQVGGSTVRTMTVAALTAMANVSTGQVAGTAPAERVNVNGNWVQVATDNTYRWSGSSSSMAPGSPGSVYYADATGNRTYLSYVVSQVYVREMGRLVYGYVPVADAVVEVRLIGRIGDSVTTRSSYNGYFEVEFDTTIQPQDWVEVDIEGQPLIRIPVVELTALPDIGADTVSGYGPADSELVVYHRYRSDINKELSLPLDRLGRLGGNDARVVRTASSGAYTANFAADSLSLNPIQGGEYGYVSFTNDDGHVIYRAYRVPLVRVDLIYDTIEIFGAPQVVWDGTLTSNGVTTGRLVKETDQDGRIITAFTLGGDPINIKRGDTIQLLPSSGSPLTIPVPAVLSVGINITTNIVSGQAPANASLRVRAFHWRDVVQPHLRGGWISRDVMVRADANGQYAADFSGYLDLVDYDYAYVQYLTPNGYEVLISTAHKQESPLVDELRLALAKESYELGPFQADTIDYGEEHVVYLTPEQGGTVYFGLGWNGGTEFKVTVEGPQGITLTQPSVYQGRGTSSPILIAVRNVQAGSTWRVTISALDVPYDGFHYVAFVSYYTAKYNIFLPMVMRESTQ